MTIKKSTKTNGDFQVRKVSGESILESLRGPRWPQELERLAPSCLWVGENTIRSLWESTTEDKKSLKESKLLHQIFNLKGS